MNLDVDFLIDFFRKHTPVKKNKPLDEQDAPEAAPAPAPAPSGGGSTGGESSGGGGKTPKKWETGLTRSVANQIDYKVTWKSLNKLARGKANTLL